MEKLFTTIVNLLHDIDVLKLRFMQRRSELMLNPDATEERKTRDVKELRGTISARLAELRTQISDCVDALSTQIETLEAPSLDVHTLAAVAELCVTPGLSDAPDYVQAALAAPYIHNELALNALLPVFKKNGISFAASEAHKRLSDFEAAKTLPMIAGDAASAATASVEGGFAMTTQLAEIIQSFASAYGFQVPESTEEYKTLSMTHAMGLMS